MTAQQMCLPGVESLHALPPPAKARPIVKWAGGKTWLIKHVGQGIWCKLSKTGGRYIEPFLGGGALALWLGLPDMILGDNLEPLIELYNTIRRFPGATAWSLSGLAVRGVDKESYYQVRSSRPTSYTQRAARFIYLNKLGFNGLYRVNKKGQFNVPYGDQAYRSSSVNKKARDAMGGLFPNKAMLHNVANALKSAQLIHGDFADVIRHAREGDVVYADPPYHATFGAYTKEGFNEDDQTRLAAALFDAHERGATILTTNSDTDLIRGCYDTWADVMPTAEKRSINSDGGGRQRIPCALYLTDSNIVGT